MAETGKWQDADTALAEAIHIFDEGHRGLRVNAVLKLADLRVSQGRLEEAEVLLGRYEDYGSSAHSRYPGETMRGFPLKGTILYGHFAANRSYISGAKNALR